MSLIINAFHGSALKMYDLRLEFQVTLPLWIFSFTGIKGISFVLFPIVTRFLLLLRHLFSAESFQWWYIVTCLSHTANENFIYTGLGEVFWKAYSVIQQKRAKGASYLWIFLVFHEPWIFLTQQQTQSPGYFLKVTKTHKFLLNIDEFVI